MEKKFRKLRFLAIPAPVDDWRWTSRGIRSNQLGSEVLSNELFGTSSAPTVTFGKIKLSGVLTPITAKHVKIGGVLTSVTQSYIKTGGVLVAIS